MQNNPYLKLGLDNNATISEVQDAYYKLRTKYQEERFQEGETGRNAAIKLQELEIAYNDCMDDIKARVAYEDNGSKYAAIGVKIKDGKLAEAQRELDDIETRDAEWHYYQSIIYYKNNWIADSKKQLEISIALDPSNGKYRQALDKINASKSAEADKANNTQEARAGYQPPPQANANRNANACCDTCCGLICLDSCCECCGGDLISCC